MQVWKTSLGSWQMSVQLSRHWIPRLELAPQKPVVILPFTSGAARALLYWFLVGIVIDHRDIGRGMATTSVKQ